MRHATDNGTIVLVLPLLFMWGCALLAVRGLAQLGRRGRR